MLRQARHVIDLNELARLVDRVEDAVPPGPQAPQIRRPVRKRLRRPRLIGELADSVPERSDTDGTVAEEARRLVPAHALAATMAQAIALTALVALGLSRQELHPCLPV